MKLLKRLRTKIINYESGDWRKLHDRLKDQILGNTTDPVLTQSSLCKLCANVAFLSQNEPKNFTQLSPMKIGF